MIFGYHWYLLCSLVVTSSTSLVLYLKTAAVGCVADNIMVKIFCIFGKILLLKVSYLFDSE